jgi:hypothetical protein
VRRAARHPHLARRPHAAPSSSETAGIPSASTWTSSPRSSRLRAPAAPGRSAPARSTSSCRSTRSSIQPTPPGARSFSIAPPATATSARRSCTCARATGVSSTTSSSSTPSPRRSSPPSPRPPKTRRWEYRR